jgi:formylglycine-generating enzyme required for sulfatase activity
MKEFQEFLKANPKVEFTAPRLAHPKEDGPAVGVTFYEALQYCRWLSDVEGVPEDQKCYPSVEEIEKCKDGTTLLRLPPDYLSRTGYRLTTEAEYEYACRAGTTSSRPWGGAEELTARYAWSQANSDEQAWPPGHKRPNDLGLFDTLGNVWQWGHAHSWDEDAGALDDVEDRRAVNDLQIFPVRGGSYNSSPRGLRSALRLFHRPTTRLPAGGLRVARTWR